MKGSLKKYYKSIEIFNKWKDKLGIIGYLNWEIEGGTLTKFLIQCWNTKDGVVLIQIFPDGCGFQDYHALTNKQESA